MLMDEEDASGSTGVIAVYDGRRHILTVAGVGDSMCVLSRSGKAVMLNRMHRLDNADEVERIKRAGGTVINKRSVFSVRASFLFYPSRRAQYVVIIV